MITLADRGIVRLTDALVLACRYASWRVMQFAVGIAALLTYVLMYVGMPDTSHPGTRGIDKELGGKFKWVWLNPFKCLRYMRSPNLLAIVSRVFSRSWPWLSGGQPLTMTYLNNTSQTFVGATALLSDFGTGFVVTWVDGVA